MNPLTAASSGIDRSAVEEFASDIAYYLSLTPRQLPSRYLYDDLGSVLFDAICRLPWYPITRAETRLLAAHGVRLSVDDFGTGYSSLAYLNDLPVHEVKIDKSFLRPDAEGRSNDAIVRTIVSMSEHLGLDTVAEGVEDEETARAVALVGCTRLQGYHIARPMPASAFPEWLAAHRVPQPRGLRSRSVAARRS